MGMANGQIETSEKSILALEEAFTARDGLQAQVEEMKLTLADKDERVRALTVEVAAVRREVDRAKKKAKFDQVARDGQTKKLGILEHSLRTIRHDLQTNLERRQKLEDKTSTLERAWQVERSLRLQDLHRHESMSSDTKNAAQAAEATEGKWLVAEKRVQELEHTLSGKIHELEGQVRVNEMQKGENDARAAEIELLRTDILELKRTLLTREGELSQGEVTTSNLKRELSRVRRDYIMSTFNQSERHRVLLGGRQGSSRQSRVPPNNSSSGSTRSNGFGQVRVSGGGKTIEEWATDTFSAPAKSKMVSRLGSSTLQAFREGGSWEDVFISRVGRIPTSTPGGRQNCLDGMSTRKEDECLSYLLVPHTPDRAKETTSSGTSDLHPVRETKPNQARPRKIAVGVCSTLRVPGSIYVGTGLGIKKEPTWVSPGGTAKEILAKILADQHQATTTDGVPPEEYD